MKYTLHFLLIIISYCLTISISNAQFDTLRVMYYNTLNYPSGGDPNREVYFKTTNLYVQADVILINELTNGDGATTLLNDALNVYGTTHYQKAAYSNGPDTDNMLFYNSDKLVLYSQWYIPTSLRHINEYVLYYKSDDLASGGDTVFFYFYSAHLKAYPEDSLQRLAEVTEFKTRVNSLTNAENIFFGGDLNLYTHEDPAYESLINDGVYPLVDPLPAGVWHNQYSYRQYHTQSTRTTSFGGGSTGGMDDRFDFILFTEDVSTGTNRVQYIDGSCIAFGNDGDDFNQAIYPPDHPVIPDSVITALYNMSDHLPVICDLKISATVDNSVSDIVITEIMYNPPEDYADTLEFIEVYNNGNSVENLGGYSLFIMDEFEFPSIVINPGEFIVVGINATSMQNTFGISTLQWTSGGLNNNGELILLKDAFGNTIDSIHYSDSSPWPASPDSDGPSLVLCNPNLDNSIGNNWQASENFVIKNASEDSIFATPGFTECLYPPIASFSANVVEVDAGGNVNFIDFSANNPDTWQWNFEGGTPATSSAQNPTITYNTPGTFFVQLIVSNANGSDLLLRENYISVINTNPNVIISEIIQNPSSVGDTEGEWFEVYNPGSTPVDMTGWTIKDNDVDAHTIGSTLIVPANGFAVLGRNSNSSVNGNYTCDYQYDDFLLSNSADEIVILNQNDEEVDRIEYDGGPSWPDPNGYSMIFTGSATDENNDYNNWQTATLREPTFVGTSGDKGSPGTNGTGQNLITDPNLEIDIKVFLEGPFNGTDMNTTLTNSTISTNFPLSQPYITPPWNYPGTENVSVIPPNVVDWVLVEIRDASDAASADEATIADQQAAFLLNDGSVVDLDGSSILSFPHFLNHSLFVVITHRNHIGILSANPLSETGGVCIYDFSTSQSQAYGFSQVNIGSNIWGMISGDSDGSGLIDNDDKSLNWENFAGTNGYLGSDLNMDTEVNNHDKNENWFPNQGEGSQVPE